MPQGASEIAEAARRSKRSSFKDADLKYFRLRNEGDSAVVRFLEQGDEIYYAYVHQLPPRGKAKWGEDEPCLDQDGDGSVECPMCLMEQNAIANGADPRNVDIARSFSGFINVIWRDGPVYKTDEQGNIDFKTIVGQADGVFTWNSGIRLFETLVEKDAQWKGLTSRDFKVTARGTGYDRKYEIEPITNEDGETVKTPLSDADKKLAAEKPDLAPQVTPRSREEIDSILKDTRGGGAGKSSNGGDVPESSGEPKNPFEDQMPDDTSAFEGTR